MKPIAALAMLFVGAVNATEAPIPATLSSLPIGVRFALQDLCRRCKFADAGAPWNETDVVDGLPERRLISVQRSGLAWRIEYEHGGHAPHRHTITFATHPKVHVVSTASCMPSKTCREW